MAFKKWITLASILFFPALPLFASETLYSLTCLNANGTVSLSLGPQQIKEIDRTLAESTHYRVYLRNGNTLYVPATCFVEISEKGDFLMPSLAH